MGSCVNSAVLRKIACIANRRMMSQNARSEIEAISIIKAGERDEN